MLSYLTLLRYAHLYVTFKIPSQDVDYHVRQDLSKGHFLVGLTITVQF
jgi:hypothetical protein